MDRSENRMLWRCSDVIGSRVRATDGEVGSITDLLFDDATWHVRWAVVDSGSWLSGREVLLPPRYFAHPDAELNEFPVDLRRERVEQSPDISTDAPVSRQMEADLYRHYNWQPYWDDLYYPSGGVVPPSYIGEGTMQPPAPQGLSRPSAANDQLPPDHTQGDPHLRSINEVTGYYVRASDDDIGHVEDFLLEEASWAIRYLIVDTQNWWPGKMVLVAPRWAREIDWRNSTLRLDRTREQVRNSPEFDPAMAVDRSYEAQLHGHYGYPPYWI